MSINHNELRKHIAQATAIVETWPIWEQNLIENSLRPTKSSPRPYVDNFKEATMSKTALERVEKYASDPSYRQYDWDGCRAVPMSEETLALAKRVAHALDLAGIEVDHVLPDCDTAEIMFEVGLSEIKVWGCPTPKEATQ